MTHRFCAGDCSEEARMGHSKVLTMRRQCCACYIIVDYDRGLSEDHESNDRGLSHNHCF